MRRNIEQMAEYAKKPYIVKASGMIPFSARKLGGRALCDAGGIAICPNIRAAVVIKPINIIFDKVFNFILILVSIDFLDNRV